VIKKWPFTYQKVKKRPILVKLFDNNLTTSAARLKLILQGYRQNPRGHTGNQGEGMGKITVVKMLNIPQKRNLSTEPAKYKKDAPRRPFAITALFSASSYQTTAS
jgi:hypothetical protein